MAAKELIEAVGALDALFVCLGGGGLLSGTALATRALPPTASSTAWSPAAGNDGQPSWRTWGKSSALPSSGATWSTSSW